MPLLSVHHLAKRFGDRTLFENIGFDVEPGDRIGLVGANGCGKTTLFQMLVGESDCDEGQVVRSASLSIGYMRQQIANDDRQSLTAFVEGVFADHIAAEQELDQINEALQTAAYEGDATLIERQAALREQLEQNGGLYYKARVRGALLGLGFSESDLDRSLSTFSGGQRSKAAMARLLLENHTLLLLDEPTNHLDVESVEWLEEFLADYRGAFIVISHDRYFLDRVTTRTIEIEYGRLYMTNGSYSTHRDKREEDRAIREKHYQNAQREIRRIEENIALLRQWNREKSIRAAESREKRVERLKAELEVPPSVLDTIRFDFTVATPSGSEVVEAGELQKSFGGTPLFANVDLHIRKGDRVFLYGPNGCGKTTLLKILNGTLFPDKGFVRLGAKVSIGYYDQTQSGLSNDNMAIDELWDAYPQLTQTAVRSAMAAFLFRGDDVFKPIALLSGGEKARLLLLKLMLARDNLLLLDEPTNHLDIASREALEKALDGYDGTMVIVSHDRYFINRMANRMLWLRPNGVETVIGNYDDLKAHMAKTASPKSSPPGKKLSGGDGGGRDAAARRRKGAQIRQLEQEIEQTENQLAEKREALAAPEIAVDYQQVLALSEEIEALEVRLDEMMERWEALQTES
ncbi:MAG: ABC-F family ATP-binding cassette domain-containing protein [Clostridia bacterium]|nr:ABC-F family ATP-binding cassette domain-containing protein [Clostridia bacterium]